MHEAELRRCLFDAWQRYIETRDTVRLDLESRHRWQFKVKPSDSVDRDFLVSMEQHVPKKVLLDLSERYLPVGLESQRSQLLTSFR